MQETILSKKGANFFGFETKLPSGKIKHNIFVIRGNGNLTLNKDGVHFKRWFPPKEYFIPLESIEKIEIKRFHNFKSQILPVLRIFFADKGKTRIFGVSVGFKKETEKWKQEIEKIKNAMN